MRYAADDAKRTAPMEGVGGAAELHGGAKGCWKDELRGEGVGEGRKGLCSNGEGRLLADGLVALLNDWAVSQNDGRRSLMVKSVFKMVGAICCF